MDEKSLVETAIQMKDKAYAPYSNFHVGAALLGKDGKVYTGCNVENAAYGPSNCAERTAVFKAVSEGDREFMAIAICGGAEGSKPQGLETDNAFPCGPCRQVLREFTKPKEFKVYVCPNKEKFNVFTLEELLPHSFGPEFLLK